MPKGHKGEKRPRDAVGAAVKSMRVLTGEDREDAPKPAKPKKPKKPAKKDR